MTQFYLPNYKPTHTLSQFEFLQDPKDKRSKLGLGSFATVKLAREKKTGTLFALKQMDIHPSKVTTADIQNLKTEIEIHKDLDHPHIIKFHGYIHEDNMIYLILDYAENGNLYTYLHRKKILTDKEIFRFFFQTCLAISYLHYNDVLHRDIKPENLLLDKDFNIKVCDFGWSAYNLDEGRKTFCGTYEYMAPEIVNNKHYDYRIDIWGMGILLYELFHNKAPYQGRSIREIKSSLSQGKINFNNETPSKAKSLILRILKTDPNNRMSMGQILSDPWVVENLDKDEIYRQRSNKKEQKTKIINSSGSKSKHNIFEKGNSDQGIQNKHPQLHVITSPFNFHDKEINEGNDMLRPPKSEAGVNRPFQSLSPLPAFPVKGTVLSALNGKKTDDKVTSPHSAQVVSSKLFEERKTPKLPLKSKRIFDENLLSPAFNDRLKKVFNNLNTKRSFGEPSDDNPENLNTEITKIELRRVQSKPSLHMHSPSNYFSLENSRINEKGSYPGSIISNHELDIPQLVPSFSSPCEGSMAKNDADGTQKMKRRRIFREISHPNLPGDINNMKENESKLDFPQAIIQGFAFIKDLWLSPNTTPMNNQEQNENGQTTKRYF